MPDSLFFSLVPRDERVPLDVLQKTIEHIGAIVRGVDQTVSRNWRTPRVWYVERIYSSNPTIQVTPSERAQIVDPMLFPDTARVVADGLESLSSGELESPPAYFSDSELKHLTMMRGAYRSALTRIDYWAEPSSADRSHDNPRPERVPSLSPVIADQAKRILGSGYVEYGTVQGELGALRVHGRRVATIWDEVHRRPVQASIQQADMEQLTPLLGKRVRLSGLVRYYNDGRPASLREVNEIRDLSPRGDRPTASFGSIPNLTNGMETTEYLRLVRGEDAG